MPLRPALLLLLLVACGSPVDPSPAPTPVSPVAPTPEAPTPPPDPGAAVLEAIAGSPAWQEHADRVREILGEVVDWEDGDPANAWALAHGILARGKDFYARDGRLARDVVVADHLVWETTDGVSRPHWPTMKDGRRVEPHPGLILKNLLERGLGLADPLSSKPGSPVALAALQAGQRRWEPTAQGQPAIFANTDEAPWLVQSWCQAASHGGPDRITTETRGDLPVATIASDLLAVLERDSAFLIEAMTAGAPVEKKRQGIYQYACGGAHLFQGVVACAAEGFPRGKDLGDRLDRLADAYLYRVSWETRLVDDAITQNPKLLLILRNQDIKFLGHLLESLGKAERDGLWTPDPPQRQALDAAETRLMAQVLRVSGMAGYQRKTLNRLRSGGDKGPQSLDPYQVSLDLIGDAAHALYGIEIQAGIRTRVQAPAPASH